MTSSSPLADSPGSVRRTDFVHALAKGLEILAAFEHGELLGNQDLVARSGMPKATVSRLTGTLVALGYLRVDAVTRKFLPGIRMLGAAAAVQRHSGVPGLLRPQLEALSADLNVTVILGAREGAGMVFLDMVQPAGLAHPVETVPGSMVPIESTALGLAYLVGAPVVEQAAWLASLRQQLPDGADDPVRTVVERAHAEFRRWGFVVSLRSRGGAVSAAGVPLTLERKGRFALACAGPSSQLTRARLHQEIGPRLRAEAEALMQAHAPN